MLFLPQVEGPGRIVKAYARLLGALEAIGCDEGTAWDTVTRIAIDSVPALRTKMIRALLGKPTAVRTSQVATTAQTSTKTASRYLEDLAMLQLAVRTKSGDADNSPDLWQASDWLRSTGLTWKVRPKSLSTHTRHYGRLKTQNQWRSTAVLQTFRSHSAQLVGAIKVGQRSLVGRIVTRHKTACWPI